MLTDPTALVASAAQRIAAQTGVSKHQVAVVLGSGWAPMVDQLRAASTEQRVELATGSLPGFIAPTVPGHTGVVASLRIAGTEVLVLVGRTHLYEGHPPEQVVHGVRVALAAGCETVLLTNAAGSIRPDWAVGQPVLVSDHINLTGRSPLVGPHFVEMTDAYSPRLRAVARTVDPDLPEGVYAALPGPHFETPAEIRALRALGAELVGMSTALETVAARAGGAEVLAISLVTNLAAGVTTSPIDHADVLRAGRASAEQVGSLLARLIAALA